MTQILVLASVAIWIAWDIYALQTDGATESEVIRDWQLAYPSIAWAIGVVFAHLTLLGRRVVKHDRTGPFILVGLTAAVVSASLLFDMSWHWVPGLGLGGVVAGRLFWAQKPEES